MSQLTTTSPDVFERKRGILRRVIDAAMSSVTATSQATKDVSSRIATGLIEAPADSRDIGDDLDAAWYAWREAWGRFQQVESLGWQHGEYVEALHNENLMYLRFLEAQRNARRHALPVRIR